MCEVLNELVQRVRNVENKLGDMRVLNDLVQRVQNVENKLGDAVRLNLSYSLTSRK